MNLLRDLRDEVGGWAIDLTALVLPMLWFLRWLLLALFALGCLAGSARALDRPVSNDIEMAGANANAVAGDRVLVSPGSYTVGIDPANIGTRWLSVGGARVNVPRIDFNGKRNTTINGFRTFSWGGGLANRDSLIDCAIYDTTSSFAPSVSDSVVCVNDSILTSAIFFTCPGDDCTLAATDRSYGSHFRNSFFYSSVQNSSAAAWRARGMTSFRSDSNQYVLAVNPVSAGDSRSFISFYMTLCSFNDDTLLILNRTSTSRQGLYLRDYTSGNTWTRCLIQQHPSSTENTSSGWFTGAGSVPGSTGDNRLIDSKVSVYGIAAHWQNDGSNYRVTGNRLCSWADEAVYIDHFGGDIFADSLYFDHNTVVSLGDDAGDQAFEWNASANLTSSVTVTNNIFVNRSHSTGNQYVLGGGKSNLTQDHNLYYALTSGDSTQAIAYAGTDYRPRGAGWSDASPFPDDSSRWGNPLLADTSRYSIDFAPLSGSMAVSSWWRDGYVGAVDPGGAPGVPSTVADLAITATTLNGFSLAWSAPDEDGGGADGATSYDIRWSTSPITSGNWDSATPFTGEPTPADFGDPEAWDTPVSAGVLAPGTTYFVALKATGPGGTSALSNVASDDTDADAAAGDPAADFDITGATSTAFDFEWLAPIDDDLSFNAGAAVSYDIRYSTSNITSGNWAAASQFTGEPTPGAYNNAEAWTCPDVLTPGTTYFVALRWYDHAGNVSALSSVATAATASDADNVRPGPFTDFIATQLSSTSVRLSWTSVGDDSVSGTAAQYDIRMGFGSAAYDEVSYAAAGQLGGEPTPLAAGNAQTMDITGLDPATVYRFGIKVRDEVPNWSALASDSAVTPVTPDATAPCTVPDLRITAVGSEQLQLAWTAPGDDACVGTATSYDIRYRTGGTLNEAAWAAATTVSGEPTPTAAGSTQSMIVTGLSNGTTYHFAIKATDEAANVGAVSNSPTGAPVAASAAVARGRRR